jgi:outer membrane immunogenic protein
MAVHRLAGLIVGCLSVLAAAGTSRVEAQNWDGSGLMRFGVFLQGSFVDYDIRQTLAPGVTLDQTASPNGWGVGISTGYDLRLGSMIVGVEADASFDDGGDKAKPNTQEQYGIDYFATLRGRLGFLVHPGFMIYGTAGIAGLGAEYKLNVAGASLKKYGILSGFVYGGGMEYDLGWGTGFIEYLRTDYGSDWSFRAPTGQMVSLDGSHDVIRLGLKFKTGHDHSHDVYRRPGGLK